MLASFEVKYAELMKINQCIYNNATIRSDWYSRNWRNTPNDLECMISNSLVVRTIK